MCVQTEQVLQLINWVVSGLYGIGVIRRKSSIQNGSVDMQIVQWFSNGGDFVPQGTIDNGGGSFGCQTRGEVLLAFNK